MATLLVPDYDEAISYFVHVLGFELIEDVALTENKRWVVVGPADGARLLLARASDDVQEAAIGRQTGGRVAFFLNTDDFAATYAEYTERGVSFNESPRQEPYGTVAVFSDLYGNRWDLIENRKAA